MSRPIIGISCNFRPHEGESGIFNIERAYTNAIYKNGGLPQVIPILPAEAIPSLLNLYDGVLLSGGGGLLPHVKEMPTLPHLREQNPVRYEFEKEIIKHALIRRMPIFGICRGHQMINDVLGGTIENLADHKHLQKEPGNQASHHVSIESDTILSQCTNNREMQVNSFHSQAVDKVGDGLKVSAYSADRIIEGIEGTSTNFVMGLQFHPELMPEDEYMMNIYKIFIDAAIKYKK